MKNSIRLIAILFFVALLIIATSCRARQMNKSSEKVESELNQESEASQNLTDKSTETTKAEAETKASEESTVIRSDENVKLTPVNPDKPILVTDENGKTKAITNAIIETGQSTTETKTKSASEHKSKAEGIKENDVTAISNIKANTQAKGSKETGNKAVKAEPVSISSFWWVLLLLFLIVLIIWYIRRRIKNPLKLF